RLDTDSALAEVIDEALLIYIPEPEADNDTAAEDMMNMRDMMAMAPAPPSLDRVLPPELLAAICDHYTFGDADTLDILRATSTRLRDAAWSSYARYSLPFKLIPLTTRSIDALHYLATHDRVAAGVKYLRLSTWSPTGSAGHLIRPLSTALAQLRALHSLYIYDGAKFTSRNQLLPTSPDDTHRWQERGIKVIFTALHASGRDASLGCLSVQKPLPYTALDVRRGEMPLECGPHFDVLTSLRLDLKTWTTTDDPDGPSLLDRLPATLSTLCQSTPNLRSLDLRAPPTVTRPSWHPDSTHVADLHIPHLRHVSFVNIRGRHGRSNEHLKRFIRRHAATLTSLELIDCAFVNLTALVAFLAVEVPLERLVRRSPRMMGVAFSRLDGRGQPSVLIVGYVQKSVLDRAARYWELDLSRRLD
ncbi:hypothetical protein Tdes44962_MAKER10365, partial [Teratosphaeria destructans]